MGIAPPESRGRWWARPPSGWPGWLGGHLAYALGVGVDTTAFQHSTDQWSPVAAEDEIAGGVLTPVDLDGVPVVLTRSEEGKIVALADRCTHRGGPLHQGTSRTAHRLPVAWQPFRVGRLGGRRSGHPPAAAYEVLAAEGQA